MSMGCVCKFSGFSLSSTTLNTPLFCSYQNGTACPFPPTLRQSRSRLDHASPLRPGARLRPSYGSGCVPLLYLLGVRLPCGSIFCQFWLWEEEQCVYLRRHLGSQKFKFLMWSNLSLFSYLIFSFLKDMRVIFSLSPQNLLFYFSHLYLQSICNWSFCMVWGSNQVIFFPLNGIEKILFPIPLKRLFFPSTGYLVESFHCGNSMVLF